MNPVQCFVINLPKDSHRKKSIISQFEGGNNIAQCNIIEAIDALNSDEVKKIYREAQDQSIKKYGHILTMGEVACFLSHQKAMKEFLKTDGNVAIIMEDDAVVMPVFWKNIQNLSLFYSENLEGVMLNLRPHKRKKYFTINNFDDFTIAKHVRVAAGAVGYMVSRKVAEELISQPIILSYDKMLQRFWEGEFINYAVIPHFVDILHCESSICKNGGISRQGHRSLSRKKIGWIKYKLNRIKIVFKHDWRDACCNVKIFGLWKVVKSILFKGGAR
ncbi:MAG: glycosyl transferase family 25 [Candidatus Deianiraeaceae bacterium]|jgi:glycosyl transferase family 25